MQPQAAGTPAPKREAHYHGFLIKKFEVRHVNDFTFSLAIQYKAYIPPILGPSTSTLQ